MAVKIDEYTRRRMILKAVKIAVGSCAAIMIAQFFSLQYATSAGIITLLTVQDTRKDTIRLAADRLLSFLLSIVLLYVCFHFLNMRMWMDYGAYIFLMVTACYFFNWPNTISVNAVMGTHFAMTPDYSLNFAVNELALVMIGTGVALALNWKMPANIGKIREDIRRIEDDMRQVLREMSYYLQGYQGGEHIWFDLDKLELRLHRGLDRAREQRNNLLTEESAYYIEYMEMRIQQCAMLQTLRGRMQKLREIPRQAGPVSRYLEYLAQYVSEENIPDEQIRALNGIFERMRKEPLPRTREEFENRAILYHILMDLEEFLLVKRRFIETNIQRPDDLQ